MKRVKRITRKTQTNIPSAIRIKPSAIPVARPSHLRPKVQRVIQSNNHRLIFPEPNIPLGEGKTCAIVGNASSILDKHDGELIDSHDVVVRINSPKIKSKESQGERTDYIFVTALTVKRLPRLREPPYVVVNISEHTPDELEYWTTEIRQQVECPKARPTTGFIATVYMISKQYRVTLFGFDWFNTPSLTTPPSINEREQAETYWQYHYPDWEKHTVETILHRSLDTQEDPYQ